MCQVVQTGCEQRCWNSRLAGFEFDPLQDHFITADDLGVKVAALTKPDEEEDLSTGGQYGVRLVISDKVSKLKKAWKKLGRKKKGNELASLKTRVQKSKSTNGITIYALVAGPLPDMGEAVELCVRLKLKGIPCAQSDFTGDPL